MPAGEGRRKHAPFVGSLRGSEQVCKRLAEDLCPGKTEHFLERAVGARHVALFVESTDRILGRFHQPLVSRFGARQGLIACAFRRDIVDRHHRAARRVRRGDELHELATPGDGNDAASDHPLENSRAERLVRTERPRHAEQRVVEGASFKRRARRTRHHGESRVVSHDEPFAVKHRHAARDRVKRSAQFTRRVTGLFVQARIDDRQGELRGKSLQHARVGVGEVGLTVQDRKHADRAVRREQRRGDHLLNVRRVARPRVRTLCLGRVVHEQGSQVEHGAAAHALRDRHIKPLNRIGDSLRGHHVQVVAAPQRHCRTIGAENGH